MTASALLARRADVPRHGSTPGILMVSAHFPPAVGGTERQAFALAVALATGGHRVTILTLARTDAAPREVRNGIVIERALTGRGRGLVFGLTYEASLVRHLRRLHVGHAILHAHHLYLEAMGAAWLGRRAGLVTLAKVAGGGANGDFARLRRTNLLRALPLLRRLDRVVAVSSEIRHELLAHGFAPDRIVQIPNGVDIRRFSPAADPESARAHAGIGPETVLFLGRLDEEKELETALAAWPLVLARRPEARLVLVGDGPARAALGSRAMELGLGDRVRFLGQRSDPETLLRAEPVFLLPSRSEGMSNALLEAMATGLACVASRVGGNTDLVDDGGTGLLVPPGDAPAMADALVALLRDAALRAKLGRAARARVMAEHGMDRITQRYADLYAELTGSSV